jgi:tripartite-type tricarboxylate transporter receptor subunit TctC
MPLLMPPLRLKSIWLAACVALVLTAFAPLHSMAAEVYPSRAVRVVAPFAPGGGTDTVARVVAQQFAEQLSKPFVVDNRTGASGIIAFEIVAKAAPDGHTLLLTNSAFASLPGLFKSLPYDTIKSFTPISEILRAPNVLVAHPSVNVTTLKDFIAVARANPGKFNYGSGGAGSALHLYGELFKIAAKVDLVHIPYKGGGDNMAALLGGQVHMNITQYQTNVIALIKSGKLRALAVTTDGKRSASLPDVPSMSEAGVAGMAIYSWAGLLAPAGLPKTLINKLHGEVVKMLAVPAVQERFAAQDAELVGSRPEVFTKLLGSEISRWAGVIRSAGIAQN